MKTEANLPVLAQASVKTLGAIRWSSEETRLLLAMLAEGVQRKAIARILGKSPRSVKKRLERIR